MSSKKKILVLVPDGTGIKNYLYSRVFKDTSAELILLHNFDSDTLSQIQKNITVAAEVQLPKYKESIREKFYRELIHSSRIRYSAKKVNNPTILKFDQRRRKGWKLKLFQAGVNFARSFVFSYDHILRLEEKYEASLRRNPYYDRIKDILVAHNVDSVFCTHQRALTAPTIFAVARDLNIKATTVIYSWDNIPKARLALKADKYLVWSKHMRDELHAFYPEIPIENIEITGTPQFEFYRDQANIIARDTFYDRFGLDKNKKILCFSGDDVLTSPHDPHYLRHLAEAVKASGLDSEVQIVFRRCPVDISGRYDGVVADYPDLIVDVPPIWNFNAEVWTAVYPTYEDVKLLASLAYYGDVVMNVGSTMAFDFGMFGKPCIFINYDAVPDPEWTTEVIYKYHHFRSMPSPEAVRWLNSKDEVASVVREALNHPETKIGDWMEVVVTDVEKASENIIKAL